MTRILHPLFVREDLVPLGKNWHELSYYHKGKLYKIQFKFNRGPKLITAVTTEQGENVTEDVLPYLGPNQDFHVPVSIPSGLEKLVYHTRYGTTKTYYQVVGTGAHS